LPVLSTGHYQQNVTIAGSEHCENAHISAGLVPLTFKFQFSIDINNVILLSLLNYNKFIVEEIWTWTSPGMKPKDWRQTSENGKGNFHFHFIFGQGIRCYP